MNYKVLNSYHLKVIALVAMIIDHIGYVFFPEDLSYRIVGRIAFILYAFMLVEGFTNTMNFRKYVSKVLIWSLASEVPFDLAMHNSLFYLKEQNIFFSLLVGLIGMYFLDKYKRSLILQVLISVFILISAILLRVNYSWYGVGIILLFYFLKERNILKLIAAQLLSIYASFFLMWVQCFAFLGLIPIVLYNEQRGRKIGNIYYSFYALHLALLYLIKITIK